MKCNTMTIKTIPSVTPAQKMSLLYQHQYSKHYQNFAALCKRNLAGFFPDKADPHRPDSVKSEYYTDFEMLLERQSSLNYINNFDIRLSLC